MPQMLGEAPKGGRWWAVLEATPDVREMHHICKVFEGFSWSAFSVIGPVCSFQAKRQGKHCKTTLRVSMSKSAFEVVPEQ